MRVENVSSKMTMLSPLCVKWSIVLSVTQESQCGVSSFVSVNGPRNMSFVYLCICLFITVHNKSDVKHRNTLGCLDQYATPNSKYAWPRLPPRLPTQKVFVQWHTQIGDTMEQSNCEAVYGCSSGGSVLLNRPISQIPQCIRQISHNATFCNRNVHMCAHFCYKMLRCGIWCRCILGFVRWVYWFTLSESFQLTPNRWGDLKTRLSH